MSRRVPSYRPRQQPAVAVREEKLFFRVVRAAFGQRRKTLANALRGGGFPKEQVRDALEHAGIDLTRRGETLTLDEFGRLADAFAIVCGTGRDEDGCQMGRRTDYC